MAANIAKTTFSTSPDDKAVVVDVYGKPPLTPTNNAPGKPPTGLLGMLTPTTAIGKEAASLLKSMADNYTKTGKVFKSPDEIIKNTADNLNISRGILREAGGNFLNSVFKFHGFYNTGIGKVVDGIARSTTGNSLEKMTASGFKDFSVTVNGVKKVIKNIEDVDSLTDLTKFLNGISPDNPFLKAVNLTEVAGVIKGVSDIAVAYNIPGAFDRLISSITDADDKKVVVGLVAAGTTNVKDLTTIDTMLDHLTGSEILSSNPDIIKLMVSGYQGGDTYSTPSSDAAMALKERLDRIDPHWFEYRLSNDTWSNDLDIFAVFGPFTRDSFLSAGMFTAPIAVAGEYKARSFVTLARDNYPLIGLPEHNA